MQADVCASSPSSDSSHQLPLPLEMAPLSAARRHAGVCASWLFSDSSHQLPLEVEMSRLLAVRMQVGVCASSPSSDSSHQFLLRVEKVPAALLIGHRSFQEAPEISYLSYL